MATDKRPYTLRLRESIFDKVGILAMWEHRSINNLIEFMIINSLREYEETHGTITPDFHKIAQKNSNPRTDAPSMRQDSVLSQ